ncbi:unnamed protein product, partial [Brachionus calyciflorus]
QKVKSAVTKNLAELMYLTPCQPNQIVTTDFAEPFRTTIRGNKYLQIIVDHFTKFLLFCQSKNAKAHTAASNIVDEWVCEYGIPEAILSDGGKHFQSVKNLDKQGKVVVLEDVQDTIVANTPEGAKNYLKELREKLEISYKIAEKNRDVKMEKSKIDFDRRLKKFEYKIGDLVLCDHPNLKKGLSQGISRKFYGPYKIKQVHKKIYFKSGLDKLQLKQEPESDCEDKQANKKTKNSNKIIENDSSKKIIQKPVDIVKSKSSSSNKQKKNQKMFRANSRLKFK